MNIQQTFLKSTFGGAFLAATLAWATAAAPVRAEHLVVPLSDPAKPAALEVSLVMGSIKVTGSATREVVIEARSRAEDEDDRRKDKDLPGDRSGMRRIPNTAIGLEAEEEGNKVSISAESWARAVDLEIQVPAGSSLALSTVNDGDIEVAKVRFRPVLLVPGSEERTFDNRPVPAPPAEIAATDKDLARDFVLEIEARDGRIDATSYWGSKQLDHLTALPYGLDKTVKLGMFGFLARPLLYSLQWIHANVVANYGWAIILLTVALKIVLLPLSLSAFKSMRKMQKLNPKMQAVRERWKGKLRDKNGRFNPDAQRQMNEEIMGLYRSEGVNPAGGCFPMLIQLPVFFSFYSLLSSAVELWHSPWILWIHDLTASDPYYVLPIVMGLSQIIQQRMTPAPPDPVQKRLMQFLPVVFTIFSLGFASGLVLYWLTNNVLTIAQQKLYNSFKDHEPQTEVVVVKGGGRRPSRSRAASAGSSIAPRSAKRSAAVPAPGS